MTDIRYIHTPDIHNTRAAEAIVPFICDLISPKSVLDVGCGTGTWLKVFMDMDITEVTGIDGDYVNQKKLVIPASKFIIHDLETPLKLERKFDLVICLEVAEHLSSAHAAKLVDMLTSHGNIILFSAAIKDQGGQNHLNEQDPSYWRDLFSLKGYKFHDLIRHSFWNNDQIDWWYRQNMFLVSNRKFEAHFPEENTNLYVHPELFYSKVADYKYLKARHDDLASGKSSPLTYLKLLIKSCIKNG
ncbi:MAG TPA: class I SAM-dependent methyltransferase [Mucilaginibacter sp.]|nr:class I SAM-dependent methyltransferase [Mucilaginibacter sp.]